MITKGSVRFFADICASIAIFMTSFSYALTLLGRSFTSAGLTAYIRYGMFIFLVAGAFLYYITFPKLSKKLLFLIIAILLLAALSCLNANNMEIFLSQGLFIELAMNLFLCLIICAISNLDLVYRICVILGRILIVLFGAIVIGNPSESYMAFGYRLLLPSVIVLHNGLYFRKRLDTLLGFVGGVLILICGSRGAALVFCISIVLYTVIMSKLKQKAGIICIAAVAGIILYMAGEKIILLALEQLNNYGFRARTLNKIVNSTIMSDSQRLQGYRYYIDLFGYSWRTTLFGLGMAGERFYSMRDLWYVQNYGYPHNLLIELYLHYGIAGGTIAIIAILKRIGVAIDRQIPDKPRLISVALFACLFQLMMSSSYIQSDFFFLFIAWSFLCEKQLKEKESKNTEATQNVGGNLACEAEKHL